MDAWYDNLCELAEFPGAERSETSRAQLREGLGLRPFIDLS